MNTPNCFYYGEYENRSNYENQLRRQIAVLEEENAMLREKYKRCRNELCLSCGRFRNSHLGYCDCCIYKVVDA